MRIARLQLRRFGHFADAELDLGEGAGLHVVYGPNEAGKSTTLDAIRYTLYGMPQGRSTEPKYDFRFKTTQIRTALELVLDSGEQLAFARSRSTKSSVHDFVTDAADTALADRLAGVVSGVPRDTWDAKHGLNQTSMRDGARALLGSAATDQSIFAAATGMVSVHRVLDELRSARRALLSDAGSAGEVHAAVKALRDATADLARARRASADFESLTAQHHALVERAEHVREQRLRAEQERASLERAVAAMGLLARRTQLTVQLAELEAVPASWTSAEHAQLAEADARLAALAARIADLEAQHGQIVAKRDSLAVDDSLLAAGDALDQLHQRLASVAQSSDALGDARALRRHAAAELRAALDAVHTDAPEGLDPAELLISDVARAQLADAIDGRAALDATLAAARAELDAARIRLEQARAARPSGDGVSGDLGALVAAIDAATGIDAIALDADVARLAARRADLEERAARIPGAALDLSAACRTQLPHESERLALETQFAQLEQRRDDARLALDQAETKLAERRVELAALDAERAVPDPHELPRLRAARDDAFTPIRDAVLDSAPLADARAHVATFEQQLSGVDELADRIAAAATSIGATDALRSSIAADEQRAARAREQLSECAAQHATLEAAWIELWRPSTIAPASVTAMHAVIADIEAIRSAAAQLHQAEADAAARRTRRDAARADLARLLDASAPLPTFEALFEQARARRTQLELARQGIDQAQGILDAATHDVEARTRALDAATTALDAHAAEWHAALDAAGLAHATSPGAARAHLDALDELRRVLAADAQAAAAVVDHEQRIEAFDGDVRRVAASLGSHAADVPLDAPQIAMQQLRARVDEARARKAAHAELVTQTEQLEDRLATERAAHAGALATIDQLLERSGATDRASLDALDQLLLARTELEQQLAALDQQLVADTRLGVDELTALIGDADEVALDARIEQLHEQAAGAAGELDTLAGETRSVAEQLGSISASRVQADATIAIRDARARLEQLVPEYRSIALQERLLADLLDERARRDMGPVVERTSAYLAQLTCGAWTRMLVDRFDDAGAPQVQLERGPAARAAADDDELAIGETVGLDGLSEGTVDQLYLALRLAILVEGAARGESMPFIVDDILPSFDDERAAATLRLLADVSAHFQVIFFTHHDHLVDLARDVVDPGVLHVHELPRFGRVPVAPV